MSDHDDILYDCLKDQFEMEYFEEGIENLSSENVCDYLSESAIESIDKVEFCFKRLNKLLNNDDWGESVTLSCTGIEIIIKSLIIGPLINSVVTSTIWAEILLVFILKKKHFFDNNFLLKILTKYDIDLDKDFNNAYETVLYKRNNYVHEAKQLNKDDAQQAQKVFLSFWHIFEQISNKVGYRLPNTVKIPDI